MYTDAAPPRLGAQGGRRLEGETGDNTVWWLLGLAALLYVLGRR